MVLNNKIIVLGSKGMLGQMVTSFFKMKGMDVTEFNNRFTEVSFSTYLDELNAIDNAVIINCIGRIKQKSEDSYDLFFANSILPLELSRSLKKEHFLVHPSTDCVFNGEQQGKSMVSDRHTALDVYGWSKSLGETAVLKRPNSIVIRVSIIGPDYNSDKGLMSWFLSNPPGQVLKGYTNHLWNGVTTLEWCKQVHRLLTSKESVKSLTEQIVQLGTDQVYSKYEMLQIFQNALGTTYSIEPYQTGEEVNRCLEPSIVSKNLEMQVRELIDYIKETNIIS